MVKKTKKLIKEVEKLRIEELDGVIPLLGNGVINVSLVSVKQCY